MGEAFNPFIGSPPAIMCLAQAITFSFVLRFPSWNPFIILLPNSPTKKGSSPKVSPTRPHRGSRITSMLGVKVQCDPVARISRAVCLPTS